MTLLLKQVFGFIKLLNSETGANQIAAGMVCGMILGFTPAFSLQTLLVILVIFFFRIQIGAALTMAFFFKLLAFALDPAFDAAGRAVLGNEGLRPLFTQLYHLPIVPLTRFNNSIVMGAGVVSLALAVPFFFVARGLVKTYRAQVVARFEKTVFWKAVKATGFYKWYAKYEELHG
ncbi:MAG: TIGR03546 family protein [Oligoflexia bacterium]|nr:TIGR03546 family protein [Oligoflexia bacterium]